MKPRSILMVAFHFPPFQGSSGLQRTLSFANHLAENDWQVTVLTATINAYENRSDAQLKNIDPRVRVVRALCLDAQLQLSIRGRYLRSLALPDRWASWRYAGFIRGAWQIMRRRPECIWSTYPIASAHQIGLDLSRAFRIPLVADFRDNMVDDSFPSDLDQRRAFDRIEAAVVKSAHVSVFTSPGTRQMYLDRYPDLRAENTALIENGYEELYFKNSDGGRSLDTDPLTILHSGILYPDDRDPTHFFDALAELKTEGFGSRVRVVLRASDFVHKYQAMVNARGLNQMVLFEPAIPYADALKEMMDGNVLLILQGPNCNHQIPAKLYEYIRAGQPIFGLTPDCSDTAAVLSQSGIAYTADISNTKDIKSTLTQLIEDADAGRVAYLENTNDFVKSCDRQNRTHQLIEVVTELQSRKR